MKTVAWIVGVLIVLGLVSGGVVRTPDGKIDVPATADQATTKAGEIAGNAADATGNAVGSGIGSAVDSSTLAKFAAAGAAATAVAKYGPKFRPKPVTVAPVTTTTARPKPAKPTTVTGPVTSPQPTAAPMSPGFTLPGGPRWEPAPPPTFHVCVVLSDC